MHRFLVLAIQIQFNIHNYISLLVIRSRKAVLSGFVITSFFFPWPLGCSVGTALLRLPPTQSNLGWP
jgi:hypothetical protein